MNMISEYNALYNVSQEFTPPNFGP